MKLMYITNRSEIAKIVDESGADRVWIDLEKIGKDERQKGDMVKSKHSISDIAPIKQILSNTELIVRVNPWNEQSSVEIDQVIEAGADIIMLPYYKTVDEVKRFLNQVDGRIRTCLLLETKEAHECLEETLALKGIDEVHIGLNDLHLSYGKVFLFEPMVDGTVQDIVGILKAKNIPYGIGGVARLGIGDLPADYILAEEYRLGSSCVILSRSFCRSDEYDNNPEQFRQTFIQGVKEIRDFERELATKDKQYFIKSYQEMNRRIERIVAAEK